MRAPIALLVLGVALIALAVGTGVVRERTQADDVRGVARLRQLLDSTRGALASATTAADSARIGREVREREFYWGRRSFHIAPRQETIDGWWTLKGQGAQLALLGALCIVAGGALLMRRRTRPDTEERTTDG